MPDALQTEPSVVERVRGVAARLLDRAPAALRARLGGAASVDGQTLDLTVSAALALAPRHDLDRLVREHPEALRARYRRETLAIRGPLAAVASARDLTLDGADGPLDGRLYWPTGGGRPPLLVYFHGGGFVEGDLDTHDEPCRLLCAEAGHAVLSVAYRLAPEHPFPAGPDDALAAFRWAQTRARDLGADPARVAVGGDSAGGNLAAAVAQAAREDAPPVAQLLLYPSVDTPTDRPSRTLFDGYFLSDAERRAFHEVHTRGVDVADDDPRLSPIYGRLDGLAPALVATAGFDVLRDEGLAYVGALRAAGTPVEHVHEPTLPHGFVNIVGMSRTARQALVGIARQWRSLVASLS